MEKAKGLLEQGMGEAQKMLKDTSKIDDLLISLEKALADRIRRPLPPP